MIKIGIDIGSTTAKIIAMNETSHIIYKAYKRHNAKAKETLLDILNELKEKVGDAEVAVNITGSVGMGVAEKCDFPFIQEVVAATKTIQNDNANIQTMIDIGGEDAKVVFFKNGQATDFRMNGNCAGGTGAFIDQMAIHLGVATSELSDLANNSKEIYQIASRCGVFSKTDVQNLIAKNVSKEDIAASIFHAVAVQVVITLAHGCDIKPPILMCGGPLTFMPALRNAFIEYLGINESDIIVPDNGLQVPAYGAALSINKDFKTYKLTELIESISKKRLEGVLSRSSLEPIFKDDNEHKAWLATKGNDGIKRSEIRAGKYEATIGIDSGSTTTKIVVLDNNGNMIYSFYDNNNGDPIGTVRRGLNIFNEKCKAANAEITITSSCSTGYGEDLIKAAFGFGHGIIETIAHYLAAKQLTKQVSFILDIGGQDMKAIFINNDIIHRMEINEACSSGCGSFIETFAKSLGYTVSQFAETACNAKSPYDLGTRCTVFMNSKVKQALREGATVGDIAAGLSYSVVKNCLYKVLRLKDTKELGEHIVVQGGTMKNDSVVRAFEKLIGHNVFRSDTPELMGAIGCAIYAAKNKCQNVELQEIINNASYTTRKAQCHGCENNCLITAYKFANGGHFYSGNRCEKVFTNKGKQVQPALNAYTEKLRLLFKRESDVAEPLLTIGIPRCLNMYENYPFWHALFTQSGIKVVLSDPSTYNKYESEAKQVMSDNICFPAKLVHSHIKNLEEKHVDRIFMPFVVYEKQDGGQNSYNCPIVSGYAEVVKGSSHNDIQIDLPAINFKDKKLLNKQCIKYLETLGVSDKIAKKAFQAALKAQSEYEKNIKQTNIDILEKSKAAGRLTIVLAGRPYHTDPLIQHKLSEMVASMGADVITEDIIRGENISTDDTNFVPQWAYANRILRAAEWAAKQDRMMQFMQMTSFGCGPDAFLTDETRSLLKRHGKALTLLKIDDMSNIGSLKLRVRSVIESMKLNGANDKTTSETEKFIKLPQFGKKDRRRKIIVPFFTPFISPLLPSLVRLAGYEAECLPISDEASSDLGLKFANNEVCYPATLIVGDIVKAFKSGKYATDDTAVIITQTGGQCRATNYISLIKKALAEAGFCDVPVISLATGSGLKAEQPGFKVNWGKILPIVVTTLIYSDCMAKLYYATVAREKEAGCAKKLLDTYLEKAQAAIAANSSKQLWALLNKATADFTNASTKRETVKVGIVGEIYLKFNPFAQKELTNKLTDMGIEIAPPLLTDFFLQSFVNNIVNQNAGLEKKMIPNTLIRLIYNKVWSKIKRANDICGRYAYFTPFESIFTKAEDASNVVSLYAQFGEGWLLPGEVIGMARQGVTHVISVQPFGCIANHIISKGIEKRIKALCPNLNILSLDFDSGVSDVNIHNRILLFIDDLLNNKSKTKYANSNI